MNTAVDVHFTRRFSPFTSSQLTKKAQRLCLDGSPGSSEGEDAPPKLGPMGKRVLTDGDLEPEAPLKTGDHDYRAFVGPPDQYDVMGATQFSLLYALGMRSDHRLLDIGCGSLRAGRLFIAYLNPGGYAGLEPNAWLVEDAIEKELGREVLALKAPVFVHNQEFDISGLGSFDFIVAQSIASHTGPTMTKELLRTIRRGLVPTGCAVVTFMHSRRSDNSTEGWFYPTCVLYRRQTIEQWCREAGLKGVALAWFHPRQTWWLLVPEEAELPSRLFRSTARGATLAMGRSWNPLVRARRPLHRWRSSLLGTLPAPALTAAVAVRTAMRKILTPRQR
jgi:SAM-dependent methyltransferase